MSTPVTFVKKSPQAICSLRRHGGEGGIRTHVPFRTTAFRVRLVTTTSILLQTKILYPSGQALSRAAKKDGG